MIVLALRIASILLLCILVITSVRGIWWLVKPMLPAKMLPEAVKSQSLMIDPLLVLQEGKSQKDKGELLARTIIARLAQIDSVLTTDTTGYRDDPRFFTEGVIAPQFVREQKIATAIEIEFRAFDVDVAGLFNSLHRQLHSGDRLHGTATIGEGKLEVMVELTSSEAIDAKGPWRVSGDSSKIQLLLDELVHQIALDFRRESHPELAKLSYDQFKEFIRGLKSYQQYMAIAGLEDRGEEASVHLDSAKTTFGDLVSSASDFSLAYPYYLSVLTLSGTPDKDLLESLLTRALKLDPNNEFTKKLAADVEKTVAQKPAQLNQALTLDDIRTQESFVESGLDTVSSQTFDRKVRIAIIASGTDTALPELAERIVEERSFVPGEEENLEDDFGMGTTLAVIVAALAPNAEILSAKVFSNRGIASDSEILSALDWAMANNAEIILAPLGGPVPSEIGEMVYQDVRDGGILVVASGPNEFSVGSIFPAAYKSVLGVGAIDVQGEITGSSAFGDPSFLFALGIGIKTLGIGGNAEERSGTSYSAAIVTAVVSAMRSHNPSLTPQQLTDILRETASPISETQFNINPIEAIEAAKSLNN